MPARTIAIGDIHGCSAALDALLAVVWPRPDDTIVTLGDSINRGPDSRGVLDRLMALGQTCHLVPILGNHDQVLLDVRSEEQSICQLLDIGGAATLASYGPGPLPVPDNYSHPRSDSGLYSYLSLIPDEHFDFLEACQDYHETDGHIFVHANYDPDIPMDEQPVGMLRWESLRGMTPGPHESGKIVIAGHTSQKGGEILDLGHLRCIDTYCYGGGWLTALDVRTEEAWQVSREGEVRRR